MNRWSRCTCNYRRYEGKNDSDRYTNAALAIMFEQGLTKQHINRALNSRILVITGAGLSADSGLQTFRGAGGLWRNYDPMSLATPEAFARDP